MTKNAWFSARRLDFIEDTLVEHGKLMRIDVMNYFDVGERTVVGDMAAYRRQQPLFKYRTAHAAYYPLRGYEPVRGSTVARRKAWASFRPRYAAYPAP